LPWSEFEVALGPYYSTEGRPAKPVRLMVGLRLLKQMFNQGDATVVAAWGAEPLLAILLRNYGLSMERAV
jgi:IS5 family transposase